MRLRDARPSTGWWARISVAERTHMCAVLAEDLFQLPRSVLMIGRGSEVDQVELAAKYAQVWGDHRRGARLMGR
jgi:hypothetical protein